MWLGSRWNGNSKTFWTFTFELLGRNIARIHFKNERIATTTLRASWFSPTLARFPEKGGIFSGTGYSKVTTDCLGLHWNGESKIFSTLPFGLLSRNIAALQLKTERVAETVLRASWFWQSSARFPETSEMYSSPKDCKLTPDGLGLHWNGHSKTFWTFSFELLGRNIARVHFKEWKNSRDRPRRIVILTNFGLSCQSLRDIFHSRGL